MNQQQETKTCKYCGTEIPKNAKVCPNCRKKQSHKVRNTILIILGIIVVIGVIGAMFSGGGNTTTTKNSTTTDTGTSETEQPTVGTVGQTMTLDGVSITLNSATVSDTVDVDGYPMTPTNGTEFLTLNFTVQNGSDSDIVVTSSSFESYVDNQTAQTSGYTYSVEGAFTSDLSLASGRETSGNIVYEVNDGWQLFETSFKPNMFIDNSIDFEVTPNEVS